jgi:ubiquinone/menaquinone biosynthesis C-methylase UbiE
MSGKVSINEVREYWDNNPLCSTIIPHELGSSEYFEYYDELRIEIESLKRSYEIHEYERFKDKKVLDVGCGNGYVSSLFAKEGAHAHGIDITPTGIELCQKRFQIMGLSGNFLVANAEELPFQDNTFDCVTSMGVLHHVPNTEKAVQEIFRVLKPGGRLIVMFYHKNSALYRIHFTLRSLFEKKTRQQLVNDFDGVGNPKGSVYSKKELGLLLHEFKNIKMWAGYLTGYMLLPRGGRFLPDFLLKPFEKVGGWNLYAKGNKLK